MSHPTSNTATPAGRSTLVLLHASASSARQWTPLAETLQATIDVHAIDLHAHGRRAAWAGPQPLSVHDDAALALDVLEHTGGGHVIGHSYGGAVALHLAAARPDLVHSLAVYEPVLLHLLLEHAPVTDALEALNLAARIRRLSAEGYDGGAAELFVDYWSGAGAWERLEPRQQVAIATRMPTVITHFDTLLAEPLPRATPCRLVMPMLVMHGTRTTHAARCVARLLERWLPGAEHEAMPGLGHMGPLTNPERVNPRLIRFLCEAAQRSAGGTHVNRAAA